MINIIFFGTPNFAVIVLRELLRKEAVEKSFGLGGIFTKKGSAVEMFALRRRLVCYTPQNKVGLLETIKKNVSKNSLFLVAGYGFIFPPEVLEYPKLGCFNIHGSLLPKYRGASPIQRAILDGAEETGVSIILMDEGIDTGKLVLQEKIAIEPTDTYSTLSKKIALRGARLAGDTLLKKLPTNLEPKAQKGSPTYAPPLKKEEGFVTAAEISQRPGLVIRKMRAFASWPRVFSSVNEIRKSYHKKPIKKDKKVIITKAGLGSGNNLVLKEVQLEGKKPISWKQFENGYLKG